jgi:hypothetical protein
MDTGKALFGTPQAGAVLLPAMQAMPPCRLAQPWLLSSCRSCLQGEQVRRQQHCQYQCIVCDVAVANTGSVVWQTLKQTSRISRDIRLQSCTLPFTDSCPHVQHVSCPRPAGGAQAC